MPMVPVLPTGSAQVQGPSEPDLRVEPVTPAASGENVAKAGEGVGRNAEQFGHELSVTLMYQLKMQQVEQGQDAASEFMRRSQDVANPLLQRQGREAKGITSGMPQATGPNQPGGALSMPQYKPGPDDIQYKDSYMGQIEKLRSEMGKDLGGRAFQVFNRFVDTHINSIRERLIQHEEQQFKIAANDSDNTLHQSLIQTAAIAPNAEEFQQQMMAGDDVASNMAVRHGRDMNDTLISNAILQGSHSQFFDAFLKNNIDRDPQLVQDVLNSVKDQLPATTSGHAKGVDDFQKTIDGKMLHVTAESQFSAANNDPKMLLPNGDVDMSKVAAHVQAQDMPQEKKDSLIRLINERNNEANRNLNEANKAGQIKLAAELYDDKLWTGPNALDKAKALALHYTPKMRNGSPMLDKLNENMNLIDKLNDPVDAETNSAMYAQLHRDIDDGRAGLADVTEALKNGQISKKSALQLQQFVAGDKSAAMHGAFEQLKDRLKETYPDPKMQNEMYHSIVEQSHKANIHEPHQFNELIEKNMGKTPTGNVSLFGLWKSSAVYGETATGLQKSNRPLVDAVGGPANAVALAQRIGGPSKLAPDTPESRAVMALIESKVKPSQINAQTIEWALKKYPDLAKPKQ